MGPAGGPTDAPTLGLAETPTTGLAGAITTSPTDTLIDDPTMSSDANPTASPAEIPTADRTNTLFDSPAAVHTKMSDSRREDKAPSLQPIETCPGNI